MHGITDLHDASVTAFTRWGFEFDTARWDVGFLKYEETRPEANPNYIHRGTYYAWSGNGTRPPYVSAADTTLDGVATSRQEQTVDLRGNATQRKEYDYGNPITPKRTYNMSYLSGTQYTNRFIFNRLSSATVTQGGQTRTLASNTYDSYAGGLVNRTGLRQHDSANYGTALVYRGNATSSTSYGSPIATTTKYDITGTPTQTTTGNTTVAVTPANNNAVPGAITPNSQSNLATSLQWNSFLGLTQKTGPNGASAAMSYDEYARPLTATSPHGAVTTYTYSNSPPVTTATVNGRWTKTKMDGLGRTIKVETGYGTNNVVSTVETKYAPCACSPLGKASQVSEPYAPGGTVYWTRYSYDAMGRTVSVRQGVSDAQPNGTGVTTYAYLGNTATVTDPAGKWKKFTLNAMGELVKATEPNPAGGADWETTYAYNAAGQLEQASMTRGGATQTRTFGYDTSGRVTSATHPETGAASYAYNAQGLLLRRTDAKNQKAEYTYDAYRRLTKIDRFAAGASQADACQSVSFTYDTQTITDTGYGTYYWGRLTEAKWGNATSCAAGQVAERYRYTLAGLPAIKRLWVSKDGKSGQLDSYYEYDNEGRMTNELYPNDQAAPYESPYLGYIYDAMGRLAEVRRKREAYSYDPPPNKKVRHASDRQRIPRSPMGGGR
ncbi:MAG: hypothetical protein KIT09_34695 [Bryobacteraceae bacterium]|nr:hypothetical protein [Bryobacteraceae bacterium]